MENQSVEIITGITTSRKRGPKKNAESRNNILGLIEAYQNAVTENGGKPLDPNSGNCPAIKLPAKKVQNHRAMKASMDLVENYGVDLSFIRSDQGDEFYCIMVPAKAKKVKAAEQGVESIVESAIAEQAEMIEQEQQEVEQEQEQQAKSQNSKSKRKRSRSQSAAASA